MNMLQLKDNKLVLVPYVLAVVGLFVALFLDKCTWPQFMVGLGLLNIPAAIGMAPKDPPPPPPPSGGDTLPMIITPMMLFALCLSGCAHASRAEARGAVLAASHAVKIGDDYCAKFALERVDIALARSCEAAYTVARAELIVAATGVDAWDEGKRGVVTCAVVHVADELARVATELRNRHIKVPPVVDDALSLVSVLGGCS